MILIYNTHMIPIYSTHMIPIYSNHMIPIYNTHIHIIPMYIIPIQNTQALIRISRSMPQNDDVRARAHTHTHTKVNAANARVAGEGSYNIHAATHCNILQHTATHCNILQLTATYCNTLQSQRSKWVRVRRRYVEHTRCTTLPNTAIHYNCNSLQHTATRCNTLQCTATHWCEKYNLLQHLAQRTATLS